MIPHGVSDLSQYYLRNNSGVTDVSYSLISVGFCMIPMKQLEQPFTLLQNNKGGLKVAQVASLGTPSHCHGESLNSQLMTFGPCTSLLYKEC